MKFSGNQGNISMRQCVDLKRLLVSTLLLAGWFAAA